jgi:hypothetical protein
VQDRGAIMTPSGMSQATAFACPSRLPPEPCRGKFEGPRMAWRRSGLEPLLEQAACQFGGSEYVRSVTKLTLWTGWDGGPALISACWSRARRAQHGQVQVHWLRGIHKHTWAVCVEQ